MSATLTILTALRDHLQAALPGYEVALFPDHPDSYRFIHPRGAVLIGYQGSKFTKLEALGMIAQQRDITLNLTVFGRGLHGDGAALDLLDALRLALVGYTPPSSLKKPSASKWQQVQQITQPDLPKFIQARTRREGTALEPDLKPNPNPPSP